MRNNRGPKTPTRFFRCLAAVLLLGSLYEPAIAEGSFQWSNTGKWCGQYCRGDDMDFKRPEIEPLIKKLKNAPSMHYAGGVAPSMEIAKTIAAYGKDAIPYALRLKEDQAFYFSYNKGYFPSFFTIRRPYINKACSIIAEIRDKAALPLLGRLIEDKEVGPSALQAYEAIASAANAETGADQEGSTEIALPAKVIRDMIFTRYGSWMTPSEEPRLYPRHMRLLAALPLPDAMAILIDVIQDGESRHIPNNPIAAYGPSLNKSDFDYVDLNGWSAKDIQNMKVLLNAIADLKSAGAFRLLYKQTYGLANAMGTYNHYGEFGQETLGEAFDKDRKNPARKEQVLALGNALLDGYCHALFTISQALGIHALVMSDSDWFWNPTLKGDGHPWEISFRVFSFRPQIEVTVLHGRVTRKDDGPGRSHLVKPPALVDADNTTWENQSVQLPAGNVFPYESEIVIHCAAQNNWEYNNGLVSLSGPSMIIVPSSIELSAHPAGYE